MAYIPPGPSGMPQGWEPPVATPAAAAPSDTSMDVEPGAWIQLQEEDLALQKYIADQQAEIDRLQIALGKEANAIERERLRWQIQQAKADLKFRYQELAEKRRVTELKLATSPIDFVAYEMYKRYLQGQAKKGEAAKPPGEVAPQIEEAAGQGTQPWGPKMGGIGPKPPGFKPPTGPPGYGGYKAKGAARTQPWDPKMGGIGPRPEDFEIPTEGTLGWRGGASGFAGPFGTPRTDQEIQAMIAGMVGEGGGSLGVGAFDVSVPGTQAISRQEGRALSQDEMAILSSFLRAGFKPGGAGQKVSYDPADYWREVEEGWIPTIKTGVTQYSF